jgi:hypothetical protein
MSRTAKTGMQPLNAVLAHPRSRSSPRAPIAYGREGSAKITGIGPSSAAFQAIALQRTPMLR